MITILGSFTSYQPNHQPWLIMAMITGPSGSLRFGSDSQDDHHLQRVAGPAVDVAPMVSRRQVQSSPGFVGSHRGTPK